MGNSQILFRVTDNGVINRDREERGNEYLWCQNRVPKILFCPCHISCPNTEMMKRYQIHRWM